jgi:hypothetical protein
MSNSDERNIPRDEKIRAILAQEIQDGATLASETRRIVGYLLHEKKGYAREDIRKDHVFEVILGQEITSSRVDFLVSVDGKPAMVIKCASGSLDSRQRQAIAAARVVTSPPVPIAVVADPETAAVLDVMTGKVIGDGYGAIPVKDQMRGRLAVQDTGHITPERMEKEKRILLAFDAIQCCVPQGAEGGVQIGEPCDTQSPPSNGT